MRLAGDHRRTDQAWRHGVDLTIRVAIRESERIFGDNRA